MDVVGEEGGSGSSLQQAAGTEMVVGVPMLAVSSLISVTARAAMAWAACQVFRGNASNSGACGMYRVVIA